MLRIFNFSFSIFHFQFLKDVVNPQELRVQYNIIEFKKKSYYGKTTEAGINFYSKTNQMQQCIKFILCLTDTLHISEGLSVHHQQFKTVHTATGICQTDTAVCLLARTRWKCSSIAVSA